MRRGPSVKNVFSWWRSGKKRRGQRQGFGFVPPLVARAPKRAARIERIEHDVAAVGPVELARVFQGGVVHDRGLPASLELGEDLPNEGGLARPESPMMRT